MTERRRLAIACGVVLALGLMLCNCVLAFGEDHFADVNKMVELDTKGEGYANQRDSRGLHLSVSNSSSLHPNSRPYGNTGEHPVGHVPVQYGYASWYGEPYHGRRTACGQRFDQNSMTAAHRTLPCGTVVRVCRTDRPDRVAKVLSSLLVSLRADPWPCVVVTITDRGPFVEGRVIDLSRAAMARIGGIEAGVVPVTLEEP